jgi:hypothetical protein
MKKNSITLLLILCACMVFGQRREAIESKIKSLKIAFITEKLNLTPEESEKFWPLYNQMDAERIAVFDEKKSDFSSEVNDKDAQAFINKHFELKEKEMLIEKKYVEKLKAVLPMRKIAKLLWVEKKFRQEVMTTILNKRKKDRE